MTRADRYWLAGFLEGEGSFTVQNRLSASGNPCQRWAVTVGSTDLDVLTRAAEIMCARLYGPVERAGRKPIWSAQLRSKGAVLKLATDLRPLMGERRRAQIDKMLEAAR